MSFAGANGEPVQMWLVYPPGFDTKKAKKYPVLHSIHGGPHAAAGDNFHYRWNNQVFAAQGYVVACVNYHGSSGFGYAFLDSITHRWGELELQDVEAATDWLLKQPWVDKSRVFATGGSYGGFMVAWMNGHVKPGRYQAYVCHAGCFDWRAHVRRRRLHLARARARRLVLGRHGEDPGAEPAHLRRPVRDADAGDPRRARLPRARPAGPGLLQHAEGARRRRAAALVPRREPLDPEAAQLASSGTASSSPG